MAGVNKVILVGRLGQDPELRQTPNGQQVCSMSMATSDVWINKEGQREEKTEWHRVILWGKQAELASKYLKKGRMAYIEGKLQTRSWQDQQGQKKYTTEIVASGLQFIDSQRDSGGAENNFGNDNPVQQESRANKPNQNASEGETSFPSSPMIDDDIPF